ncbi:MAG: hypothetical protein M3N14_00260 [Bacteroidota bacterium]|nr:hypothetical protein [Bacteroidota bacterium]
MPIKPEFKSVIEEITCPVHHQHPTLTIDENDSVKLTCCCTEFKVQCYHLLKKFLSSHDDLSGLDAKK